MEVEGKILKLERNALWQLVFYHDLNKATYFEKKEDAYECNEEGRYSRLNNINKLYRINGKYEFLLEYPEINKSNQWRQTLNPLHQNQSTKDVNATGYEEINIQMNDKKWGGMFYFSGKKCLLAGSSNFYWHYAIGTCTDEFAPYFPGPEVYSKIVKLWIRMPLSLGRYTCRNVKNKIEIISLFH